jgi:hypothetical protein
MVNRVAAEGLQVRQYFHRFTDDALDLCDVLGSYVPGVKVKLDEVTKIWDYRVSRKGSTVAKWRKWFGPGRSKKSPGIAKVTS